MLIFSCGLAFTQGIAYLLPDPAAPGLNHNPGRFLKPAPVAWGVIQAVGTVLFGWIGLLLVDALGLYQGYSNRDLPTYQIATEAGT